MHSIRTIATDNPVAWCVSQSVCSALACALQKPLNGSRSCLYWNPNSWGPKTLYYTDVGYRFSVFPHGFNAAFARLLWPLVFRLILWPMNKFMILNEYVKTRYRPLWDVTIADPPRCPLWCRLVTVPTDPFTRPNGPFLSEWVTCQPGNTQNGGTVLPIANLMADCESGSPVSCSSLGHP